MKKLKFDPDKDTKELEKYGFEFTLGGYPTKCIDNKEANRKMGAKDYNDFAFLTLYLDTMYFDVDFQDMEDYYSIDLSIIYDLIKANLLIVESNEDEK